MLSDYDVQLVNDNMQEFHIIFSGPEDTPYQGGQWRLHVELPDQYPYKSPSIGFVNRIYHPNIDEMYAFWVCLYILVTNTMVMGCAGLTHPTLTHPIHTHHIL